MKNRRVLIILVSLFLCMLIGLSFTITDVSLNNTLELLVSLGILISLVVVIVFSIKLKRYSPKNKISAIVDENVLKGRKEYKRILRGHFKTWLYLILAGTFIGFTIIIFYIIKFNLFMLIFSCVMMLIVPLFIFAITYFISKPFYFPYKEIIFNNETFVLFLSKRSFHKRRYDPCFHVFYNGNGYTTLGREIWVGDGFDNLSIALIGDLFDWFNDKKFTNYLRIDVDTEKSGRVQCVCKLGLNQFRVTNDLNKLKGCFEISRSQVKKNKK